VLDGAARFYFVENSQHWFCGIMDFWLSLRNLIALQFAEVTLTFG
jgi:hypothetical protein